MKLGDFGLAKIIGEDSFTTTLYDATLCPFPFTLLLHRCPVRAGILANVPYS